MVFDKFKKRLYTELNNRYLDVKNISDNMLYSIALEIIGNEHITDAFLISEFGGFSQGEINRIKRNRNSRHLISPDAW